MSSRRLTPAEVLANYKKLNPTSEPHSPGGKDYMTLVEAYMKETGESKAEAMRQVTRRHPAAHERWIRKMNER